MSRKPYQGNDVNAALGICVLGTVIVSCSPKIWSSPTRTVMTRPTAPEGGVQWHRRRRSRPRRTRIRVRTDGKLYFNIGNDGRLKTPDGKSFIVDKAGNEIDGRQATYRQGLVFRCNLDMSGVRRSANFRNNYEVTVDSFGTIWQSDNDDDGNKGVRINYVMEFGNYGYTDELTGRGWRTQHQSGKGRTSRHWHQNDGRDPKPHPDR